MHNIRKRACFVDNSISFHRGSHLNRSIRRVSNSRDIYGGNVVALCGYTSAEIRVRSRFWVWHKVNLIPFGNVWNLCDSIRSMYMEGKKRKVRERKINLIYFKRTCLSLPPGLLISNTVNLHFVEAIHRLIIEYIRRINDGFQYSAGVILNRNRFSVDPW